VDEAQSQTPAAPKKKGGVLKILLFSVLVLMLAGGGGAWWWLGGHKTVAAATEPGLETRGLLPFEPFLVNLTDAGGARFLKVTVQLVLGSDAEVKKVQEAPVLVSQARSDILELLSEQSAPVLVTPDGKQALKKAIRERVAPVFQHEQVVDVLFSEFVVQF
jgi:flagellar FliL protein